MSDYCTELDEMIWSFSRVNGYDQCKYYWYLRYLENRKGEQNIYAIFGKFCHKVLEKYAKYELKNYELAEYYSNHYEEEVINLVHDMPDETVQKYYGLGLDYFQNCDLDLEKYEILGVELECNFKIGDYNFVGYIDLLLRDKITRDIIVQDHKSSEYPIGKRGGIKKKKEKDYLLYKRQLYLYCQPVFEKYGEQVKFIQWNYFKERQWLTLPFIQEEYEEALQWASNTIKEIYKETEFPETKDYFYCRNLCNYRRSCEYQNS